MQNVIVINFSVYHHMGRMFAATVRPSTRDELFHLCSSNATGNAITIRPVILRPKLISRHTWIIDRARIIVTVQCQIVQGKESNLLCPSYNKEFNRRIRYLSNGDPSSENSQVTSSNRSRPERSTIYFLTTDSLCILKCRFTFGSKTAERNSNKINIKQQERNKNLIPIKKFVVIWITAFLYR